MQEYPTRNIYAATIRLPSTGQALHFSSCVLSCLLSCTHTANTATLSRFTLEGLQPTCILSASTCNQRRQRFNRETLPPCLTHSPTIRRHKAIRNHCRQFRQPGLFRPDSPQRIAQTVNDRQPAERNAARLAEALATIRRPGPYQPPQFAPIGQRFPVFPAGCLRPIQATRARILARLLAYLYTNECIFAYSQ